MQIGEVYVSKANATYDEGTTVLVVVQPFGERSWEMVECLVLRDECSTSMYGPGTTDEWTVDQIQRLFTRLM